MSSSVTISAKKERMQLSMLPAYFMRMLASYYLYNFKIPLYNCVWSPCPKISTFFLFRALLIFWGLDLRECTTFSLLSGLHSFWRARHFFLTVVCPQTPCRAVLLTNAKGKGGWKLNREKFDFGQFDFAISDLCSLLATQQKWN